MPLQTPVDLDLSFMLLGDDSSSVLDEEPVPATLPSPTRTRPRAQTVPGPKFHLPPPLVRQESITPLDLAGLNYFEIMPPQTRMGVIQAISERRRTATSPTITPHLPPLVEDGRPKKARRPSLLIKKNKHQRRSSLKPSTSPSSAPIAMLASTSRKEEKIDPGSPCIKESETFSQHGRASFAAPAPHVHFAGSSQPELFEQYALPGSSELQEAGQSIVYSQDGMGIPFRLLWQEQKTIVLFIRHFMCPQCQDYMYSIARNLSPQLLDEAGLKLVIISNGSYEFIRPYRAIFKMPFAIYTDPTRRVYNALGMTLQTLDPGPPGNYIRHGLVGGIGMVVKNAIKTHMPLWKDSGEIKQLGGEFVFGPGQQCTFAHRMRFTRSHLPILDVIRKAGIDTTFSPPSIQLCVPGQSFLNLDIDSERDEETLLDACKKELAGLWDKRASRRGGEQWCTGNECILVP